MKIERRAFLKRSALGLGGVLVGSHLVAADTPEPKSFDPYELVPIGKTKLKFSRVAMGTGSHGGYRQSNQVREGREALQKLLRDGYDRGIRTFDLADLYGSHTYLPPALEGIPRDNYTIITKIWWTQGGLPETDRPPADVVVARFLKELKTDYIDLLLLHCVMAENWSDQLRSQMDIMTKLKEQGKVRALGVSCHTLEALRTAINEPWVECVLARINPFGMSMDGSASEVVPLLKKLHAAGKGVVGMKIIGEGRLSHDDARRDQSVKFALNLGCVDVLDVGFEKTWQIDDFAARVRKVPVLA